jgi:hypothetical protein
MSMSRKHFNDLAQQLSFQKPNGSDKTLVMKTWVRCCLSVASVCNNHNSNFDKARFLDACGVPDRYK